MAGSNYERVLAAEWLAVFSVETFDALSGADTGKFSLPDPSRYFAMMVVYLMLAAGAMFGEKAGRLAAAFGGVAALAIIIAPSKKTGHSPIVGALGYFAKIMGSGPTGNTSGGLPAGTIGPQGPVSGTGGAPTTTGPPPFRINLPTFGHANTQA